MKLKPVVKMLLAAAIAASISAVAAEPLQDEKASESSGFTNAEPEKEKPKKPVVTQETRAKNNLKSASAEDGVFNKISRDADIFTEQSYESFGKANKKDLPKEAQDYMDRKNDGAVYRNDVAGRDDSNKKASDTLRQNTIETTAVGFAAQAGLKWRYDQINYILKTKYQGMLDEINFRPFVTDQNILMPSILITKNEENFLGPQKMVKSNINFVVADEARIVSVPPTYRDYLIRYYSDPKKIHPVLKPRNGEEMAAWKKGILKGWDLGIKQANDIFKDGFLRLERDIQGRVNYRKMVSLKMISPAALKVSKRGVTFNDRTMNVGETVFEITNAVNFTNIEDWRSAWLKSDDFGASN